MATATVPKTATSTPLAQKGTSARLAPYEPPRPRFPFYWKEAKLFNIPEPGQPEYDKGLARLMRTLNRKLGRKGGRLQRRARQKHKAQIERQGFDPEKLELILRRTPDNQFRLVFALHK